MQAALVPGVAPMYLKLTRTGTTFTGAWSTDAFTWHAIGTVAVPLAPDALAGLPVTSHNTTATTTATFGNVNVWR